MTSAATGVEIARYDDLPRGSLSGLLKLLWSPSADLNRRHLEWKYERNPYAGSRIYFARAGEEIVAMLGIYGARYVTGKGAGTPGVMCAGDVVITPEYRGRGVLRQIMTRALEDLADRDVDFLLSFSASASVRLGALAAGWGSTPPVKRLRRPDPAATSKGLMSRLRAGAAPAGNGRFRESAVSVARSLEKSETAAGAMVRRLARWAPFAAVDRMAKLDDGAAISSQARPGEMADLLRRVEADGRIRHLRDETYFRWRFGSPLSAYRFFFLGREAIDAYLVVQACYYPMHGKSIRIADWVGVSSEARVAVLRGALAALPNGTIDVWTSSLADEERTLLQKSGFVEEVSRSAADYSPAVLSRPVASPIPPRPWSFGGRDILDIDSWNLRLLDSDGC